MSKRTKAEIEEDFIGLSCELSPENLCCDGEISQTEVNRRYRDCMKRWKALEKEYGRKVSEDEAFDWMMANVNKRFPRK